MKKRGLLPAMSQCFVVFISCHDCLALQLVRQVIIAAGHKPVSIGHPAQSIALVIKTYVPQWTWPLGLSPAVVKVQISRLEKKQLTASWPAREPRASTAEHAKDRAKVERSFSLMVRQ